MPPLPFRKAVLDTAAYVPDWVGVDRSKCLRLDRNEGTFPVPDFVKQAIVDQVEQHGVHTYPDADILTEPLGAYCGVPATSILPTAGSDQAINVVLHAFLEEGSTMLVARPEFPVFGHVADGIGARVLGVPYNNDLSFPYDEFRSAVDDEPDLIVLINPNNPTGTPIDRDFIVDIIKRNPNTPVIVDEAYYEFTGETVASLTQEHENLIVFRTFSKAFSMAGLRLGYLVAAPHVVGELSKLRNVFDVNLLAVIAGNAYLGNIEPSRQYVQELVNEIKPATVDRLRGLDLDVSAGAGNFMLVRIPDVDAAVDYLRRHDILVRTQKHPLLKGMFRMSIGSADEMQGVTEVIAQFLRDQGR